MHMRMWCSLSTARPFWRRGLCGVLCRVLCSVLCSGLLFSGLSSPAAAAESYKVIGADGSVTYTDRSPTVDQRRRVVTLGADGQASSPAAPERLPRALQATVKRQPVQLFTSADCSPCDHARQLLRQRGVPHVEWRIVSQADVDALRRLTHDTTVPALRVGQQLLHGVQDGDWQQLLDRAGYPRQSQLPADWLWPAAQTLTPATPLLAHDERADLPSARVAPVARPQLPTTPPATLPVGY